MERCSKDSESRRTTTARSLDFQVGGENDSDASSSEVSNADSRGRSTPVATVGVKDLLRMKLQGKLSSSSTEIDILGKWHRELSVAGFSGEIHCISRKSIHLSTRSSPSLISLNVCLFYTPQMFIPMPNKRDRFSLFV